MLYVGTFSFVVPDTKPPDVGSGRFTCVAEADDVDGALSAIRSRIHAVGIEAELFDGGTKVYLDDLIEFQSVPRDGVLVGYAGDVHGDGLHSSIGCGLPAEAEGVECYGADLPEDGEGTTEPFLVIGEGDED